MSLQIKESVQFRVEELIIVTKSGKIDISNIYEEIDIFDSLFVSVMSGRVIIRDSIGLSDKLIFDGSESLLIHIKKDDSGSLNPNLNFKKAFRIYKQANRSNENFNSELYTLHFVSDELIYSDQQRITQGYDSTYTEIVMNILSDYLKVPANSMLGIYDQTEGIRKVVIPNLRPLEAIEWCAKRSTDSKQSANFLFYENNTGFNFASLSNILTLPSIHRIKFEPKNINQRNAGEEMYSARSLEIVNQTNVVEKTRSGVLSGKYIGFDFVTRMIETRDLNYNSHYESMKHGNENPNLSVIPNRANKQNVEEYDSRKAVWPFASARKYSQYIKKYDPTSIAKNDNFEDYVFQRKAIFSNLTERRLRLVVPGNFQLSSGFNVDLEIPIMGKKVPGSTDDNLDKTLSGKYVIIGTRHIIGFEKHETVIEVASSSTANDIVPAGTSEQTQEIMNY